MAGGFVYIARDGDDHVIYVGSTIDIHTRLSTRRREAPWWAMTEAVDVGEFETEQQARRAEDDLICLLDPPYNSRGGHGPRRPGCSGRRCRRMHERATHSQAQRAHQVERRHRPVGTCSVTGPDVHAEGDAAEVDAEQATVDDWIRTRRWRSIPMISPFGAEPADEAAQPEPTAAEHDLPPIGPVRPLTAAARSWGDHASRRRENEKCRRGRRGRNPGPRMSGRVLLNRERTPARQQATTNGPPHLNGDRAHARRPGNDLHSYCRGSPEHCAEPGSLAPHEEHPYSMAAPEPSDPHDAIGASGLNGPAVQTAGRARCA